jgi:hypothetical protein
MQDPTYSLANATKNGLLHFFLESFLRGVSVCKISVRAFGVACLSARFLRELLVWRVCLQDFCESFWSGVSVCKISVRAFGLACLSARFL